MRKIGLLIALLSVCLFSTAIAHNGPVVSDSVALESELNFTHYETDDFTATGTIIPDDEMKGTFTLTVTNSGDGAWGDFHFAITNGFGGDAASVLFTDLALGGQDPTSSQTLDGGANVGWVIDNTVGELSTIDLYFYGDSVGGSDTASFTVYTDNTAENLSYFGICAYPTPVPEPATLATLGFGALALLRRKK